MVKDDSLYIVAIVAVVAVVGLVIMATGSNTVVVAEDLPSMVDSDDAAIAGQAGFNDYKFGALKSNMKILTNKAIKDAEKSDTSSSDSSSSSDTSDDDDSGETVDEPEDGVHNRDGSCPEGVDC